MAEHNKSKMSLNIDQRNKTYSLHSNGSTITEGRYTRLERTPSCIRLDSLDIKTKNVNINWE
jgi:hypothetical protein